MSESSKYAPLTLAYIGDSVHTLFVRERVIGQSDKKVHELHILTSRYVKASAQAKAIHILLPELNEEEEEIYKRGRNAKSATVPKNAIVSDYRAATGFEALIGALYIDKKKERLNEILARSMDIINTED